jgi:hypothetical protein
MHWASLTSARTLELSHESGRRDVFGAQVPMRSHAPPAAAISTRLADIFPLDKPILESQ